MNFHFVECVLRVFIALLGVLSMVINQRHHAVYESSFAVVLRVKLNAIRRQLAVDNFTHQLQLKLRKFRLQYDATGNSTTKSSIGYGLE